jgi:hypothetical protein
VGIGEEKAVGGEGDRRSSTALDAAVASTARHVHRRDPRGELGRDTRHDLRIGVERAGVGL